MSTLLWAPTTGDPPDGAAWAPGVGDAAGGNFWALGVGEVITAAAVVVGAAVAAGVVSSTLTLATDPGTVEWPSRGVRVVVGWPGLDHDQGKLFDQYSADREVYEVDFTSKYLSQLVDTADTLAAFIAPAGAPFASQVPVGGSLAGSGGLVMFSAGPGLPVGTHAVEVQISTDGGRLKSCLVHIRVDS